MFHLEKFDAIVHDIIEPAALAVDRDAAFPRAVIDALGKSGLLGLMGATEVGSLGLGLPEAVTVIERIAMAWWRPRIGSIFFAAALLIAALNEFEKDFAGKKAANS